MASLASSSTGNNNKNSTTSNNSYTTLTKLLEISQEVYNKKSTRITESLLKKMPLESINKKTNGYGFTPLDCAYQNDYPIKNDIVQLIRQHGGKANYYDRNGKNVGEGEGDLND